LVACRGLRLDSSRPSQRDDQESRERQRPTDENDYDEDHDQERMPAKLR